MFHSSFWSYIMQPCIVSENYDLYQACLISTNHGSSVGFSIYGQVFDCGVLLSVNDPNLHKTIVPENLQLSTPVKSFLHYKQKSLAN